MTAKLLGKTWLVILLALANILLLGYEYTSGESHVTEFSRTLILIVIILIAAKLSTALEKWGQPAVLGELLIGVLLGNLVLLGVPFFEPIRDSHVLHFLAELGVVILMFQIGLETDIEEMLKVGGRASLVALIGVVVPFGLGTFVVGPVFFPSLSFNAHLFLGATLTATSVGITARVLKDMGQLTSMAARIILGAAVIDDVLALVILALVSGIVATGSLSVGALGWIMLKAALFLFSSLVVGRAIAPHVSAFLSRIHDGVAMQFTYAISFCFLYAYIAHVIGLEPIIGAFAAGVMIEAVHFKTFRATQLIQDVRETLAGVAAGKRKHIEDVLTKHTDRHIDRIIEPLAFLLVPIFFILTGFAVDVGVLADPGVVTVALVVSAIAVAGKLVAGVAATKGDRWKVGWGMVPRGEVGLIFATVGRGLGVIPDAVFSVLVIVVILTTLVSPPMLGWLAKRKVGPKSVLYS